MALFSTINDMERTTLGPGGEGGNIFTGESVGMGGGLGVSGAFGGLGVANFGIGRTCGNWRTAQPFTMRTRARVASSARRM